MKVVLTYRVLPHWRTPVFRRLASWPGIRFVALHGSDFPGTRTRNGENLEGFEHRELWTWRILQSVREDRELTMPLFPGLFLHLLRERPDVILAEGGSNLANNFAVFGYAALTRTPVVWWTLGALEHRGPLAWWQRLFRRLVVGMERRSAALLGYSSAALRYFRRQGYPEERQFRAVNCVDTDLVEEQIAAVADRVGPLRASLGLDGKRVLLFVGALAPFKRVEDLIAVHARLARRYPDLALLIVGDGPHRAALERCAAAAGARAVVFTGAVVEGVAAYFELGDVLVLPGLGGLVISEAMTHGLPVIATRADGCEEDLIEDGRSGYILPVGDLDALEERLESLLGDPERLVAMGAASRQRIQERYNIRNYMENLVAALHYAATGRRPVD